MSIDTKHCSKCNSDKSINDFYKSRFPKDGLYAYCKSCHIILTTNKRSRRCSDHYTKRDILNNRWQGLKSRQGTRGYEGVKVLCTKSEFLKELDNEELQVLYDAWVSGGRTFASTPSIDRIDPRGHYELSNMRWLSFSENARRGGKNRWINR